MTTILPSTGESEASSETAGAFVVQIFFFVIYLLKFVKNRIKKGYMFTITITPLFHEIHVKMHIPPQFINLVCFYCFQFGRSVWFCLFLKKRISITGSGWKNLVHLAHQRFFSIRDWLLAMAMVSIISKRYPKDNISTSLTQDAHDVTCSSRGGPSTAATRTQRCAGVGRTRRDDDWRRRRSGTAQRWPSRYTGSSCRQSLGSNTWGGY